MRRSETSINPTVRVSWGELIDKMTILEIKERRLISPEAVANVRQELAELKLAIQDTYSRDTLLSNCAKELKAINETLWEIEDKIRESEAEERFDQEFIDLARSIYFQNDKRGDVKRRINMLMKSDLVEEKQYAAYGRETATSPKTR